MSRRAALVVAGAAVLLAVASVAMGTAAAYSHVWQAESMFAGETGSTDKRVFGSILEFVPQGDGYRGALRYHDALAIISGPGDVLSQEAMIELEFEGAPQAGGTVGGTFAGTVTLTDRQVESVSEALAPPAGWGTITTYEVTGHWGGTAKSDLVIGELIYETAVPGATSGTVREVAWLNRSSFENPDMLGEAQTYQAPIRDAFTDALRDKADGPAQGDDSTKREPGADGATDADASDGDAGQDGGGSDSAAAGSGAGASGVLAFIRRGASGGHDDTLGWAPTDAVQAAGALRDARPAGAREVPDNAVSIDIEYSGAYLDAKNRAAGLLGEDGPTFPDVESLTQALDGMRAAAPGIPALPPDVDAGRFWADFGLQTLRSHTDVPGAEELIARLQNAPAGLDPDAVLALRTSAMAALAAFRGPFGSVLPGVASSARLTADAPLQPGAATGAVLAAARDPRAPDSARVVTAFARADALDVARDDGAAMATLPATVMNGPNGPGIGFSNGGTTSVLDPSRWTAYRRADGAVHYLAEGHEFALTDASLLGWAYSETRGALADANDVGILVAYTPYRR